eukprot:2515762-Pyramimonas_sp.AAC.1
MVTGGQQQHILRWLGVLVRAAISCLGEVRSKPHPPTGETQRAVETTPTDRRTSRWKPHPPTGEST